MFAYNPLCEMPHAFSWEAHDDAMESVLDNPKLDVDLALSQIDTDIDFDDVIY